jgi:hypothetical protein
MTTVFEQHSFKNSKFSYKLFLEKPDLKHMIHVHQVHSHKVVHYQNEKSLDHIQADGIRFKYKPTKEMNFAIKTADCLCICLVAKESAAILHAGWRGLANPIVQSQELENFHPLEAFISCHISKDTFEVSEDFKDNFPSSSHLFSKVEDKCYFDLEAEAKTQLLNRWPDIHITSSKHCTYKNTDLHSYRRNKTEKRLWHVLSSTPSS